MLAINNLFPYLTGIQWQDIVDISLNTYILFRLYILFRGTNALKMLIAIAFLWFFHRITVSLGLIVTSWAIQGITAATALIIIVVFGNEIRSVFQSKNLRAILWNIPVKIIQTPVEIISESVFEMAKRHCGALIAFPGKESLKSVVQNGISLQGIISKEMITTIFWHNNPVHDGAVIIRGERIAEVSVILPLSSRTDLPSYYGTRHRAAIGLTGMTDAMVVVVSEERGVVTLAKGNQISVMHNRAELEQKLEEHIGKKPKSYLSYLLKTRILEPIIVGICCMLLVTGIWFGVTKGLNTLIQLEVPIEYLNRDPAMEIVFISANKVRLHLSGSDMLVKSIKPDQIRVKIDMSKAIMGRNNFPITKENISLPPGIVLSKVDPQVVKMDMDVLSNKILPVQVDWAGKLPEHLILESATLSPEKIQITGITRLLDNISTIYTEKVPLDKIESSGKITVSPLLNSSLLKIAPGSKEKITIAYVVKERVVE